MLTPRQQLVLRKVVDGYLACGAPVGSKLLAADVELHWGSSTIRHELAMLEEFGLLAHPHTSAGRVPTESGYRYFVDNLVQTSGRARSLDLDLARREVDDAMRTAVETLSQATDLLAIVSAPPLNTATVRHVEVLLLQPQVLMVVVITSTGGVTKRVFTFDRSVDPGLVDWASSYLREQLVGVGLGARMLRQKLTAVDLSQAERAFIDQLAPAFTQLEQAEQETLYVDGTARLLSEGRSDEIAQLNELIELLERRVNLLSVLRTELGSRELAVRIGHENEIPALQSVALISAGYGLPRRQLGTVSVIGPLRMDYAAAIDSVRGVVSELSHFITQVYEEP